MRKVNVLRENTPLQSIAYKELSFEIGLYASKEENEEMRKSKTKISPRMYLRRVIT